MLPVVIGVLWLQGCSQVDELTAEKEIQEVTAEERKQAEDAAKSCQPAGSAAGPPGELQGDCVLFPAAKQLNDDASKTAVIELQKTFKFRCVDCTGACKDPFQVQELAKEPRWQGDDAGKYGPEQSPEAGSTWEHGSLQDCHGEAEKDNDGKDRMCGGFVVALFKATDGQKDGQKFCSQYMVAKALEDPKSGLNFIQAERGGTDKTDKKDRYDVAVEDAKQWHWDKDRWQKEQSSTGATTGGDATSSDAPTTTRAGAIELVSDSGSRAEEARPPRPPRAEDTRSGQDWVVSPNGATKRGSKATLVED